MPVTHRDAVKSYYTTLERLRNRLEDTFPVGDDKYGRGELGNLSDKLDDLREKVFKDGKLTEKEAADLYGAMSLASQAFMQIAEKRGFNPRAAGVETTEERFKLYVEAQQIQMQTFAGEDLRGGLAKAFVTEVAEAVRGGVLDVSRRDLKKVATQVALGLITSPSPEVARNKVGVLRAQLATLGTGKGAAGQATDLDVMRKALALVAAEVGQLVNTVRTPTAIPPISAAEVERALDYGGVATVRKVEIPNEVRGTGELFPRRPFDGWDQRVRSEVAAAFTDLEKAGKFVLDDPAKFGPGEARTVCIKLDLNLGIDAEPSVSSYAQTYATAAEMLARADARGGAVHLKIGDSCGGENIGIGRSTMDIIRDTGQLHGGLKAGLEFARQKAADDDDGAKLAAIDEALARIQACADRGVFFGAREDTMTTRAQLDEAIDLAKPWVELVDFDVTGYKTVRPHLDTVSAAAWGNSEFRMAKDWVDADIRIHAARGISTHLLAGYTGALKGLIGLHASGLRPTDQGMNSNGQYLEDTFALLAGVSGLGAVFARRAGGDQLLAKIDESRDPDVASARDGARSLWTRVKDRTAAFAFYEKQVAALVKDLKAFRRGGATEDMVMERMKSRMIAIVDEADVKDPGFKRALHEASHAGTKAFMVAARHFRFAIPREMKDEQAGNRIALLGNIPYPSDLVVQTQAKVGIGGGPDAFHDTRDVGVITVGTSDAAVDVATWGHLPLDERRAGQEPNVYRENPPIWSAVMFGNAPAHPDFIQDFRGLGERS